MAWEKKPECSNKQAKCWYSVKLTNQATKKKLLYYIEKVV